MFPVRAKIWVKERKRERKGKVSEKQTMTKKEVGQGAEV